MSYTPDTQKLRDSLLTSLTSDLNELDSILVERIKHSGEWNDAHIEYIKNIRSEIVKFENLLYNLF